MTNSAPKKATVAKRRGILPNCNAISYSIPITAMQDKAKQIDPMILFMVIVPTVYMLKLKRPLQKVVGF